MRTYGLGLTPELYVGCWMLDVGDIAYIKSGLWIAFYRKLVETNLNLLISMYLLVWIDV